MDKGGGRRVTADGCERRREIVWVSGGRLCWRKRGKLWDGIRRLGKLKLGVFFKKKLYVNR